MSFAIIHRLESETYRSQLPNLTAANWLNAPVGWISTEEDAQTEFELRLEKERQYIVMDCRRVIHNWLINLGLDH
jgi:hypothetical protein